MENNERLGHWMLDNMSSLRLTMNELKWPEISKIDIFDFSSTIMIDGKLYEGRGLSRSKEDAISKSVVEAIERFYCFDNDIQSNGVAAHPIREIAYENAKLELIERDNFLIHYLMKSKGKLSKIDESLANYTDFLSFHKVKIKFEMRDCSLGDEFVYFFWASKDRRNFIGLGCSHDPVAAQRKAIHEALTNLTAFLFNGYFPSFGLHDFSTIKYPTSKDQLYLSRHASFNWFKPLEENILTTALTPEVQYKELTTSHEIFKDIPLTVVQASSSDLQNLYFGKTEEYNINFKRLNNILNKDIQFSDLNNLPHPIG